MWNVVVRVVAVVVAAVWWATRLRDQIKGARLVIVGPRKSGKTTLYRFMSSQTQIRPQDYKPTQGFPSRKVDLSFLQENVWSDLGWDVQTLHAEVRDSPGGTAGRPHWHDAAKDATLLVFIADARLMLEPSEQGEAHRKQTISDANQVGSWDSVATGRLPVLVVLSHLDQVPEQGTLVIQDLVLGNDDVKDLRRALRANGPSRVVLANLLDAHDASNVALHAVGLAVEADKP